MGQMLRFRLLGSFVFASVCVCAACELAYETHEAPESTDTGIDAGKDTAVVIPGPCKPPGYYCGNDKVPGDPNILYQCVADADAKIHERCEAGCKIAPPGSDDYCIK
jgi:hypothetical protein